MRDTKTTVNAAWRRILGLVAIIAMGAVASTASAQSLGQDDYKDGLDKATQTYKEGNLSQALVEYLEVRAKFSGPEVDYSLARTYHKLQQCKDAQVFYMFVMNSYDLPEDDQLFSKAANYYNEIINCDSWGSVELTCTPGAMLYINDDLKGTCMQRTYSFREGTYTFRIEAEGAAPTEEKVKVSDGATTQVALALENKVVEKLVQVPMGGIGQAAVEPNYLAWGLIGGGVAVLGTSALFNAAGFSALVDVQRAADQGNTSSRTAAEDDVSLNQLLTGVTLGVGLAAAGTGVVLLLLDGGSEAETALNASELQLSIGPTQDGGAMFLHGTF